MSSSEFQPILRDSNSGGPERRRPVGVTAAAIVPGLFACAVFVMACFTLRNVLHRSSAAYHPPWAAATQVGMMVVLFLLSSFAMCVVVGLLQMKRWARFGILLFGGLLSVYYGAFAIGVGATTVFLPTRVPHGSPRRDDAYRHSVGLSASLDGVDRRVVAGVFQLAADTSAICGERIGAAVERQCIHVIRKKVPFRESQ
jgi:hypothetical protein